MLYLTLIVTTGVILGTFIHRKFPWTRASWACFLVQSSLDSSEVSRAGVAIARWKTPVAAGIYSESTAVSLEMPRFIEFPEQLRTSGFLISTKNNNTRDNRRLSWDKDTIEGLYVTNTFLGIADTPTVNRGANDISSFFSYFFQFEYNIWLLLKRSVNKRNRVSFRVSYNTTSSRQWNNKNFLFLLDRLFFFIT